MSDGYNGYENWATWNVCLWLGNEETWYRDAVRRFRARKADERSAESFCRDDIFFGGKTPDMDTAREMDAVNWEEVADCINEMAGHNEAED